MSGGGRHDIVIAGGGAEAWSTAAALLRTLGSGSNSVTVVETADDPARRPFGVGDATLPAPAGFDRALFPDEAELVARHGASWSFGIALSGWSGLGGTYFHPFGDVGADLGPVAFHQAVQRLRHEGVSVRFANYSLSAMAAQAGRFQLPSDDPRSVLSTCRHGLHIGLEQIARQARSEVLAAGGRVADGSLADVEFDENGAIAALATTSGDRVGGSLFVDCSGSSTQLIARLPGSRWEDWSGWLPCDRTVSAVVEAPDAPLPYSHAEAFGSGWVRYLPTQGETVLDAVFDSTFCNDDQVLERFHEFAGNGAMERVTSAHAGFGRRQNAWNRNCVALGASAVLIDPVGVSNLQLLRTGIHRLCTLLPGGASNAVMAAEFNRQTAAEVCHARDFAMLHYRLNGRVGEPFWDAARKMAVPASLGYRLQLFANLGRVAMYDFEPLAEVSWINLFDEHGVRPRQIHPIAMGVGKEDLMAHAERVRAVMVKAVQDMPLHADYLSRVRSDDSGRPSRKT